MTPGTPMRTCHRVQPPHFGGYVKWWDGFVYAGEVEGATVLRMNGQWSVWPHDVWIVEEDPRGAM